MSVKSISSLWRLPIIFATVMLWQLSCGSLEAKSARLPDGIITGGSTVGLGDALRALRIAVGLTVPTESDFARGDVSPLVNNMPRIDGRIDLSDALLILQKVVGLTDWVSDPPAGTLDVTFGDGGLSIIPLDNGQSCGKILGIQPDGKIVIGGPYFPMLSSYPTSIVLRLNANGSPDVGFGPVGNGVIGPYAIDIEALTTQADGKIVLAGLSPNGSEYKSAVVRINSDGTDDISFGSNGRVIKPLSEIFYNQASAIALQRDSKIVVAGYVHKGSDFSGSYYAIARYNQDGSIDAGFGSNGLIIDDYNGHFSNPANSIASQPDGKIVVAGVTSLPLDNFLLRFNPDGTPDASFGTGGAASTDPLSTWDIDTIPTITIQDDDKILLTGLVNGLPTSIRYTSSGSLDTSFGTEGKISAVYPDNYCGLAYNVGSQADGKLVIAGGRKDGSKDFVMVRYNSDGTLDAGFGEGGVATADLGGVFFSSRTIGVQPDGRLIAAGCLNLPEGLRLALLRVWP